MLTLMRERRDIEALAQDLARDAREMKRDEIIICTDGNINSMSKAEFEILKVMLAHLAPGIPVVYRSEKK